MIFNRTRNTSRDNHIINFSNYHLSPILRNLLFAHCLGPLLTQFAPALFSGCSRYEIQIPGYKSMVQEETVLNFSGDIATGGENILDIFVFEDDRLRRLDAYQRIDSFDGMLPGVSSTGGEKIFFICAYGHRNLYEWADISSYSSLGKIFTELDDELPSKPVMTGECRTTAGSDNATIILKPFVSEVVLRSISCDFSGTAYSESQLRNVKVYLTNVNASCPMLFTETTRPSRIINAGQLTLSDLKDFRIPDIIFKNIAEHVDKSILYPDIRLFCYPNIPAANDPGSPQTRMVIEGEVDDRTYYWPITISGSAGYTGVERGCRYVYDIRIRRKGVTDPDIPFNPGSIDINMKVKPWIEKEEYAVGF